MTAYRRAELHRVVLTSRNRVQLAAGLTPTERQLADQAVAALDRLRKALVLAGDDDGLGDQ